MAQPFLEHRQHVLVTATVGVDHAMRREACLRQRRSEQVAAGADPQHGPAAATKPCGNASDEQGGGGVVVEAAPGPANFVQGGDHKPFSDQLAVDRANAERKAARCGLTASNFKRANLRPKRIEASGRRWA